MFNLVVNEGKSTGSDAGATGERIGNWASSGKKRPRKLSQSDYEAGHRDPHKVAIFRVGKKISQKAGKTASDARKASLKKRVSYGANAMGDLHQGIKKSQRDGGGAQDPDKAPGTLKPITLGKISRRPESATGSLSQSIKHGKLALKAGKKAAKKASGEFAAGLEQGGQKLRPGSKLAKAAKQSKTQTAAEEIRTTLRKKKNTEKQAAGSRTKKVASTPSRKKAKVDSRNRRKRAQTYGDPKKGYKDASKDPDMKNFMDFGL